MKIKNISVSLMLSCLLMICFIGLTIPNISNVYAVPTDNDYTFETETFYNDSPTTQYFNVGNETQPSGHFNATHSFENEIGDTDTDIDVFNSINGVWENVEVISSYKGHRGVVELEVVEDNWKNIQMTISGTSGTISGWYLVETAPSNTALRLLGYQGANLKAVFFGFDHTNYLLCKDGGVETNIHALTPLLGNWQHIRVDFECGAGGYNGLSADTFCVYLNGTYHGDYDFDNTATSLDSIKFDVGTSTNDFRYVDALGFSCDNYVIGENINEIYNKTNTLNDDKWEFSHIGYTPRSLGNFQTGNGWTSGAEIIQDDISTIDKRVLFNHTAEEDTILYNAIDKDTSDSYYNLTYKIQIESFSTTTDNTPFIMHMEDYDNDYITTMTFTRDYIYFYDYLSVSNDITYTINDQVGTYIISICWRDSGIEYAGISIYLNGTFIYGVNKIATAGISDVKFYIDEAISDGYQEWILDYCSLYVDGISQTTAKSFDGAFLGYDFDASQTNLFTFEMNGTMSLSLNDFELFPYSSYNGTYFINKVDSTLSYDGCMLVINSTYDYQLHNVNIRGIRLDMDSYEYFPTYTYSNMNGNFSYFYVQNSRLYYSGQFNDSNQEYMEISFDIDNLLTVNRTLAYSGYTSFNYAEFRLHYLDTTILGLELGYTIKNFNYILEQDKQMTDFSLLITDNDEFNGVNITGYISDIHLNYNINLGLSITTISLISMIIPLIVIIVPSLVLHKRFGSGALIPSIILMSFICVIGSLIPLWMGAVITIGCLLFLFLKDKVEA